MGQIETKNLGLVKGPSLLASQIIWNAPITGAMNNRDLFDAILVGRRIEAIRRAKDLGTQADFASRIGASKNRYNNWAVGVSPVPVGFAAKIRALTGATLDYIYLGDLSGMPSALSKAIEDAEASLEDGLPGK